MLPEIEIPTLILDQRRCLENIQRMVDKAQAAAVIFRPHFKTHQSHIVGGWFRDYGVRQITVSSLGMARYFADDGWNDITVAFPVNLREAQSLRILPQVCRLNLLVEDAGVVVDLDAIVDCEVGVYIKIDVGTSRTGIYFSSLNELDRCVEQIDRSRHLVWRGFLAHAGHTYSARTRQVITDIYQTTTEQLRSLKKRYVSSYPDIQISYGDTPSCSTMAAFEGIDEIRPGNFVFYDCMQVQIGSCSLDHIAVAMICPVVAVHSKRNEVVVYGGGIHFGKDVIHNQDGSKHYGIAVDESSESWQVRDDGAYLKSLSQEHGIVSMPMGIDTHLKPGSTMTFLPVHSCMTAQSMGRYIIAQNGQYVDHYAAPIHRSPQIHS